MEITIQSKAHSLIMIHNLFLRKQDPDAAFKNCSREYILSVSFHSLHPFNPLWCVSLTHRKIVRSDLYTYVTDSLAGEQLHKVPGTLFLVILEVLPLMYQHLPVDYTRGATVRQARQQTNHLLYFTCPSYSNVLVALLHHHRPQK